jgi:hypothetical protein
VDGGFPGTVVSALEITDAVGIYSFPADMVNDLGNPNIGHMHVRKNGKLLEIGMSNSDGAGGHQVLFQVDLAQSKARRFVKVAIDDDRTKTHDWTAMTKRKATGPTGKDTNQTMIYDVQLNPTITAHKTFSEMITIGPPGKKAEIRIVWSVGKDRTGCLKITKIQVDRISGDPSLAISKVKHSASSSCAMEFPFGSDKTRFQDAIIGLNYKTRIGIKTYEFNGYIASIQGNGRFTNLE